MKQGRFITFEGIDGYGKTTQMQLLKEMLEAEGEANVAVCASRVEQIGEQIRQVLLSKANTAMFDLIELLFEAARTQLVHEGLHRPRTAGWIICDRFFDSTEAYQVSAWLGSDLHADSMQSPSAMCVPILHCGLI